MKRDAVDELHHDEENAVVFADLEDLRDVRMIERSGGLRLTGETLHPIQIRSYFGSQHFQCDFAIKPGVPGEVHFAHPARAKPGEYLVVINVCAGANSHFAGDLIASDLLPSF